MDQIELSLYLSNFVPVLPCNTTSEANDVDHNDEVALKSSVSTLLVGTQIVQMQDDLVVAEQSISLQQFIKQQSADECIKI